MKSQNLKQQWFPIAKECDVKKKPQRHYLFGIGIILFRYQKEIYALQDYCPHRGAPLSSGTFKNGLLQCPYHGWTFNHRGECQFIPGLDKPINLKNKGVKAYTVEIKYGLVFICLEKESSTQNRYTISALEQSAYTFSLFKFEQRGELINVLENILDATHTHFVHSKIIRSDKHRKNVTIAVKVDEFSAEILYEEDKTQSGFIGALLEGNRKYTTGKFTYPLVAELEYYSHSGLTSSFSFFLAPKCQDTINIFLVITYKKNIFLNWMQKLIYFPFVKIAAKQDLHILNLQRENLSACPGNPQFISTKMDIIRPHIINIINGNSKEFAKKMTLNI